MNFRRRLSEVVCKSPYAAESGNSLRGEREGKTEPMISVDILYGAEELKPVIEAS